MKFMTTRKQLSQVETAALLIGCFEGEPEVGLVSHVDTAGGGNFAAQAALEGFSGKVGEILLYVPFGTIAAKRVIAIGLGKRDKFGPDALRKALAAGFKICREKKLAEVTVAEIPLTGTKVTQYQFAVAVASVSGLVDYEINHNKTGIMGFKQRPHLEDLSLLTLRKTSASTRRGLFAGRMTAQAVNFARDLSNLPAGELTPTAFVEEATRIASESGGLIALKVYDMDELHVLGANGILAVSKGSDEPCYLIEMTYTPPTGATKDVLGLVGKAVCFDSGGLDIKPADGMRHMKRDMSGGGAVLATIEAIAALRLPISVKAYMAPVENMINGKSYKPGDRIRMMGGITVEVDNTDAEGRLTLADMISHALRTGGVTHIVDVATLTGAVRQVTADVAAGLFSNNDAFAKAVKEAGARVGEKYEHLTMWPELREFNRSDIADLKNSGGPRGAGACTAAWFIREFAGEEIPWVHLDIASVAFREFEVGIDPKGSTGFAVQTLLELATTFSKKSVAAK